MKFSNKFYAKLLNLFIDSRPKLNVTTKRYNEISRILEKKDCDVFISDSEMKCPLFNFEILKAVDYINGMKNLKYIKDKRDCLPKDTLLLKANGKLISIKEIKEGDKIIGKDGEITTVLAKDFRGLKKCINFKLNNSSKSFIVSEEHKLEIAENSGKIWKKEQAKNVLINQKLQKPTKLEFEECGNIGYNWGKLMGMYLGDGWIEGNRIFISARDGKPKEKNKQWIKDYLGDSVEIKERWAIIKDEKLKKQILELFGTGCMNKRFYTHNFSDETIKGILDGWKVDANERENSLVYSTVNYNLALSLRILHRKIGKQVSIIKVENHGGFGDNPIYRIGVRRTGDRKVLVKGIKENEKELECYDITTSNGMIYLPEHDIICFNCDDYATYLRAMMRLTYQNLAFGECWVKIGDYDHAMCFFIDKDGKINYIEPQNNTLVSSRGVKPYLMII